MILSGPEILKRLADGSVVITPFKQENLNPNSYNLTLGDKLLVYSDPILDLKKQNPTKEITLTEEGFILHPGELYLAKTQEWTETRGLVPLLEGRSSVARLGLFVHVTAGFGDSGYNGQWTLELVPTKPLKIYPGVKICQIVYHTLEGEEVSYNGKYQNATDVLSSKFHLDK